MTHVVTDLRNEEPICEFALELMPSKESLPTLIQQFGISPEKTTRIGWERKGFDLEHIRSGIVEPWPHYLHLSLAFYKPPGSVQTAGRLKQLFRDNANASLFRQCLPQEKVVIKFCKQLLEITPGRFLCVALPDQSVFDELYGLQRRIDEALRRAGLGEVRKTIPPERAHLTLSGIWVHGGPKADQKLKEHQLQFGSGHRDFELTFDSVAVTPWPTDKSDKRKQFPSGWAASWFCGKGAGKSGFKGHGKCDGKGGFKGVGKSADKGGLKGRGKGADGSNTSMGGISVPIPSSSSSGSTMQVHALDPVLALAAPTALPATAGSATPGNNMQSTDGSDLSAEDWVVVSRGRRGRAQE